jgi:hypothetical protein
MIANSPSITAWASLPAKAAQVFTPNGVADHLASHAGRLADGEAQDAVLTRRSEGGSLKPPPIFLRLLEL